jgi:drug/metabolite transporter (DMT)-like permease
MAERCQPGTQMLGGGVARGPGTAGTSGRILTQYLALAVTWGVSFLFIKVGLEELSPGQVVLARLMLGAMALWLVCAVSRQPIPTAPEVWGHLLAVVVLLCVIPFLLFAWAEQYVSSGLASIYNATTPLMTMAVALVALPAERLSRTRLAGLLTGFAGVTLVLSPWHLAVGNGDSRHQLLGRLACLGATLSYGLAFVYLRRFLAPRGLSAIPVATVQVTLGALVMLTLTPLIASQPVRLTLPVVASMLALGVFGTGLAYVWNTNIVAGWGATNASTVTYLTPVVGVAAGAIVLAEHVSWNQPLGAVVVLIGIAVSQDRLSATRARLARALLSSHVCAPDQDATSIISPDEPRQPADDFAI